MPPRQCKHDLKDDGCTNINCTYLHINLNSAVLQLQLRLLTRHQQQPPQTRVHQQQLLQQPPQQPPQQVFRLMQQRPFSAQSDPMQQRPRRAQSETRQQRPRHAQNGLCNCCGHRRSYCGHWINCSKPDPKSQHTVMQILADVDSHTN